MQKINPDTLNNTLKIKPKRMKKNLRYRNVLHFLNKHAFLRTKILWHKINAFISNELRKMIMLRLKLKNAFYKNCFYENWCNCKLQHKFSVDL